MLPSSSLTLIDGGLGVMPPNVGDILAIVGPAPAGPLNTPAGFARGKDVISNYTGGEAVEAACFAIENTGKPVVFVRCAATTAGSYGALTIAFAGTSVPTLDTSTHPDDEYEAKLLAIKPGTIGTAGITVKWSLDGGRTLSEETALGTASTFTFPGSGGVTVNLAAGTVLAGDYLTFPCVPPQASNADLSAALAALRMTKLKWDGVLIVARMGASALASVQSDLMAMETAGKYRWAFGNTRPLNAGETEGQFFTAMQAAFAASAATRVGVCGPYVKTLSSRTRRTYRRSVAWSVAVRAVSVDAKTDLAEVDLGPLPGVQLDDGNGNPEDHDESAYPGLDDLRITTLRTVPGYEGVYITNPRVMAPTGSDFLYLQYRRIMDIACETIQTYLTRRLSKTILLDKKTGFVFELEALEIESGANAALRTALLSTGRASAAQYVMSRTDNVLSTFLVNGDARVTPPGYTKFFATNVGFYNPALRTIKV